MNDAAKYAVIGAIGVAVTAVILALWQRRAGGAVAGEPDAAAIPPEPSRTRLAAVAEPAAMPAPLDASRLETVVTNHAVRPAPATIGTLKVVEINHGDAAGDEGEWVRIVNAGEWPVQLAGWRLSDEGDKHRYIFPDCVIAPEAHVRVHMWHGADTPTELYVGRKLHWWNNDGDTAYLHDAAGTLVHAHRYGSAVDA